MIYGTPLLRQMIFQEILKDRLKRVGMKDKRIYNWLLLLNRKKASESSYVPNEKALKSLSGYKLISSKQFDSLKRESRQTIPLPFVTAINLELTYSCNLTCTHCLQRSLRQLDHTRWLSTDIAARVIREAWFAGLLSSGVNFTGGEVFSHHSNLPELLEVTNSLNISARVNTNGWWGRKKKIQIGSRLFSDAGKLISWLVGHNVKILALSLDERYVTNPSLWKSVVHIMVECKNRGLPFQLVSTGKTDEKLQKKLLDLALKKRITRQEMIIVPMEMVDIGGDFPADDESLNVMNLKSSKYFSTCMNNGFTKPTYLHISPDGGVRTCMYAPGSEALGNVHERSLLHIINHFIDNPVVRLFREGDMNEFIEKFFTPHLDLYRQIQHPCAGSALIWRFAEKLHNSDSDVLSIHMQIAEEYNLMAKI